MKHEKSLREFLLENEHFVPKNYKEGNITNRGLNGQGIEVNYGQSYIRSGPAYEENVYEESVVGSGKFNPEEAGSYVPVAEQGETVFTPRYYHEEPVL